MTLDRRSAGLAVLAALTGLAASAAGSARAQDAGAGAEAHVAELHRQIAALFGVVLAHADFAKVDGFFAEAIRANSAQIGGDTDAFAAHVSEFLRHVAEASATDAQAAGAHIADMLIQMHMQ